MNQLCYSLLYDQMIRHSSPLILATQFIAIVFIIAKKWNKPKCPSTVEWIMKMWHIYTVGYYAAIQKSCTWQENGWI